MCKQMIGWVLLGTVGWSMSPAIACTSMQVLPSNKVAKGSALTLVCKTDVNVKQVAVEIAGSDWNTAIPNLYDDGTHGDSVANDKAYSFKMTAPPAAGSYRIKFYRVLPDQNELESELTFETQ